MDSNSTAGTTSGGLDGGAATGGIPVRRGTRAALLVTLLCFVVYNSNLRLISAGDCYPARYLPFSILKNRTLALDPILDIVSQGHTHPFWCVESGGHTYSRYPVTVPVLVTPLYLPAVAYLDRVGWTDQRLEDAARVMEKVTASLIASLSAGLMYLLIVRRTGCRWPLLLTAAYAFGTNTWMISSQALWQHGTAQLFVVLSLYLALGRATAWRAIALGVCLALIAAARPPDALISAAIGLYGLGWARGRVGCLLAGAAIGVAPILAYNYSVAGTLAGGYGVGIKSSPFKNSVLPGILGLLFSPARGLVVFSPFLLFLPAGVLRLVREPRERALALLALGAVALQTVLYATLDWRGGWSWGPRLLTDVVPLLVWMLAAGFGDGLRPVGFAAFVLAVGLSVGIQAVGAFWYTGASNAVLFAEPNGDPNSPTTWDPRNAPFLVELRHDPAPRDSLLSAEGTVDRVRVDGAVVSEFLPGAELEIEGWTLVDRHSPAAVQVVLVPTGTTYWTNKRQYPIAATAAFVERTDVTRAGKGKGPAGWRVVLKTDGLDPGPHLIELKVLGYPGGELRHVAKRRIEVLPAVPDAQFRVAAGRLRAGQHADGYWHTRHTRSTRFDNPVSEMNVFLTAMIHELLAPVAGRDPAGSAGLVGALARARRHLGDQIEPTGLVRFHGRPDAPSLPRHGCVITPDADDTALAWAIAGSDADGRVGAALEALNSYRDPDGLYRTWLAPREQYVSIDPGADPNPPDVAIQMHVLMFLDRFDRPAAGRLSRALRPAVGDDRLWVYYRRAPLIPIWRAAELHNLGYPLTLPEDRLHPAAPGQEVWVAACRLLARLTTKGAPRPPADEVREVLDRLSRSDFAAVRTTPPLLFHNDLTARCSRYYWSEDFGYALWLRLYLELR